MSDCNHFNPRSREGSDEERYTDKSLERIISIHAPAKGATPPLFVTYGLAILFQSTLPRRERPPFLRCKIAVFAFQSTLPRRERQQVRAKKSKYPSISIHAPAKGATVIRRSNAVAIPVFQSTLPRRERRWTRVQNRHCRSNFNPRSREGSDWRRTMPIEWLK